MKHIFKIDGMTCKGCVATVTERLLALPGINLVNKDLGGAEAVISMTTHIPLSRFKAALQDKYSISEATSDEPTTTFEADAQKSKWQQLRPLFLIFLYLICVSIFVHYNDWNYQAVMLLINLT